MEGIILSLIFIIIIILLKFMLNIKIKDIKELKELGYDKNLNEITNKLPDNITVAKKVLNMLENTHTTVEQNEDSKNKTSLYIVITDKISIANIKNTFTRIQTISHECIHSIQNKSILLTNFIYTNLYNIFFLVLIILKLFNIIENPIIWAFALTLAGIIYYVIRAYLENDAMLRGRYLAEKYILNENILNKEEITSILNGYDKINSIGIKLYNYRLLIEVFIRNIILSILFVF